MAINIQLSKQLNNLATLIQTLSEDQYVYKSKHLANASIGAHTRHIIELLQCALNGYEAQQIDYINRSRNLAIETDMQLALDLIESLKTQSILQDKIVHVVNDDGSTYYSSYNRELVYNVEHIIHHLALIKVSLIELNIEAIDENLGMAYSTIQYKKSLQKI